MSHDDMSKIYMQKMEELPSPFPFNWIELISDGPTLKLMNAWVCIHFFLIETLIFILKINSSILYYILIEHPIFLKIILNKKYLSTHALK